MSSLLRLECKQKNSSNAFQIGIVLFRTYSFGIEMINRGYYMAARRYEISLQVLKNISRVSANTNELQKHFTLI